jgi:hypothetical protein
MYGNGRATRQNAQTNSLICLNSHGLECVGGDYLSPQLVVATTFGGMMVGMLEATPRDLVGADSEREMKLR